MTQKLHHHHWPDPNTNFWGKFAGDFWYPVSTPLGFEAIFFGRDKNFAHIRILLSPWTTLSPIIMEVENHPKWKETNIGDTPIFHWTMMGKLMGLEDDSLPFGEPKGLFSGWGVANLLLNFRECTVTGLRKKKKTINKLSRGESSLGQAPRNDSIGSCFPWSLYASCLTLLMVQKSHSQPHVMVLKPYKKLDIYHMNWCRIFSSNSM